MGQTPFPHGITPLEFMALRNDPKHHRGIPNMGPNAQIVPIEGHRIPILAMERGAIVCMGHICHAIGGMG